MAASAPVSQSNSIVRKSSHALLLISLCFTLSGAAGLIYEVLWMRMLGWVFGATTIAVSVVLAAFMGGLALGSAVGGKVAGRMARPLRTYAWIEIMIGLYALAVPIAFRALDRLDAALWQQIHPGTFSFALLRFVLAAIVLLIPTALMGATLPVIVAAIRQYGATAPRYDQPILRSEFAGGDRRHTGRWISVAANIRDARDGLVGGSDKSADWNRCVNRFAT
jgi:predicted membrane-bound spermidine synthase